MTSFFIFSMFGVFSEGKKRQKPELDPYNHPADKRLKVCLHTVIYDELFVSEFYLRAGKCIVPKDKYKSRGNPIIILIPIRGGQKLTLLLTFIFMMMYSG